MIELLRRERERYHDADTGAVVFAGGKHADNRVWLAVQADLLSDDGWIRTESALPELVSQDHDVVLACLAFIRQETPPQKKGVAQGGKKIRRY